MFLLATLLSFGWPKERTIYLPAPDATLLASGELKAIRLATCCGSMRPAIRGGELAYVEEYKGQRPLKGYIISTLEFTHRVTAETDKAVRTSGDANRYSDRWTPRNEILYIIRYIVRG